MWRRLLAHLRASGITVRNLEPPANTGDTDLVAIQRGLYGIKAEQFVGDGSLIIFDADDEWQAADAVAVG